MNLKSEIAFSFYLERFSMVLNDSDKLSANKTLLDQIVLVTNPVLNFESDPSSSYVNFILEIFDQIKTQTALETYSRKIINSENFKEIMDNEKKADIVILGKERKYYDDIKSFREDLNFESCHKIIIKAMDKALLCNSDDEFPEENKELLKHKKRMIEHNKAMDEYVDLL